MAVNILGAINVQDDDYVYLHTFGQDIIYDGLEQILGDHNADMELAESLFIQGSTPDHQMKIKLPGGGRMQEMTSQAEPAESKVGGEYSVGLPLKNYGSSIALTDIEWGYMTAREFNRQMTDALNKDRNSRRAQILAALFNNQPRVVKDERWPDITVQPLANNDGTLYPPVVGSEDITQANHYLGVTTAMDGDYGTPTGITNANNPLPLIVNTLEQHFGTPTGGSEIVVFCNNKQTVGLQNLAGFDTVPNRFVEYGANASVVRVDDGEMADLPGRILGESDSALLAEWRWCPPGYMMAFHFGAPRPLMRRVDDPKSGFLPGLRMIAADIRNPFNKFKWRNRFGVGVVNRLNGVIIDLKTGGGNYTVPARYAF